MADPLSVAQGQESPNAPVTADVLNAAKQGQLKQQKQLQWTPDMMGNAQLLAQALAAPSSFASGGRPQPQQTAAQQFQALLKGGPYG